MTPHETIRPRAVVIAAMPEEAAAFAALADERGEGAASSAGGASGVGVDAVVASAEPAQGEHAFVTVAGSTVALIRSGIGFANATAAAAHAFHSFGRETPLLSIGTAGGLAPDIEVGDVIIGDRYLNLNADATAFGYALGQVPGMPHDYEGDRGLVATLTEPTEAFPVRLRTIGSSEVFVTRTRADALRTSFPTVAAVDMESAAIAQYAHVKRMPFVSVRAISDLCAPDGQEFLTHLDHAADRAARVVADALRRAR